MPPVADFAEDYWLDTEPRKIERVPPGALASSAFPGAFFYELWKAWSELDGKLLRVSARLVEPYVPAAGIRVHLDSLLAYAVASAYEDRLETREVRVVPIPAAAAWTDGARVLWAVGDLAPRPGTWRRDKRYRHRRYKEAEAEWSKKRSANLQVGRWKDNRTPVEAIIADRICAYMIGDAELVSELLSRVTHVGSNTHRGFGRVAEWDVREVEPEAEDFEFVFRSYVMPTRNLPAIFGTDVIGHGMAYHPAVAWTPPYWYAPWHSPGFVPRGKAAHACD